MVSNVSFGNQVNQNQYIEQGNVATKKYATSPVKQETQADSFLSTVKSSLGFATIFQGIPLLNFLRNTKKVQGSIKPNALVEQIAKNNIAAKNTLLNGEGNIVKRFVDYAVKVEKTDSALSSVRSAVSAEAKSIKMAEKAQKMAQEGTKSAKQIAKVNKKATKAASKFVDKADDAQKMIKNINKTAKAATKAGTQVGKLTKAKNFVKSSGMGLQVVMTGAMELFSEVLPTFKELGFKKGMKQIGKSSVKVLGDVAGFASFQAIGAALGTVLFAGVPVVGPFLGAALGIAMGSVGSFAAGKVTDKMVGPSERKIAEQQQEQVVEKNNPFSEFEATV